MQLTDQHNRFLCPSCGEDYVHLDNVYIAGRPREDGDIVPVHVNAAGHVKQGFEVDLPTADIGRRHAITIAGWCELCGANFAIEFKQHKGQTEVRVLQKEWRPLTP